MAVPSQYLRSVRSGFGFPSPIRLIFAVLLAALGTMVSPAFSAPFLYVSLADRKVAVIDIATNTVIKEIAVPGGPQGIAADRAGRFVYVANAISNDISVIDTQSNLAIRSIGPLTSSGGPFGIAVHPNGSRLYATNPFANLLSVVDVATGLPLAQIPLVLPRAVAVSPTGSFAYVSASRADINAPATSRSSAVIDLQQNRVIAELPIQPMSVSNIVFSPDGSRAYFGEGAAVAVVDTATHTVIARWTTAYAEGYGLLSNIALSADGSRLYVVTYNDKKLVTIDTATGAVLSRFGYDNEPTGLVVNSAQQTAILFGERTGLATSVNLNTGEIIKSNQTGGSPRALGAAVVTPEPAQPVDSGGASGGGGGCGYISGSGGPADPTLPTLIALALLTLALRRRARQR